MDHPPVPPEPQDLTIIIFDSGHQNSINSKVRVSVEEANDSPPQINVEPPDGPGEILDGTTGVTGLVNLRTPLAQAAIEAVAFFLDPKSSANGVFAVHTTDGHTVGVLSEKINV